MKILKIKGKRVLIDNEDHDLVTSFNWQLDRKGYLFALKQINKIRKRYYIHREILKTPLNMFTDHVNGNIYDNRKSNLRICTNQQNMLNRGKRSHSKNNYKGVIQVPSGRFIARIRYDNIIYHIGTFDKEDQAARAYNKYAKSLHGEFARLNIIKRK